MEIWVGSAVVYLAMELITRNPQELNMDHWYAEFSHAEYSFDLTTQGHYYLRSWASAVLVRSKTIDVDDESTCFFNFISCSFDIEWLVNSGTLFTMAGCMNGVPSAIFYATSWTLNVCNSLHHYCVTLQVIWFRHHRNGQCVVIYYDFFKVYLIKNCW